MRSALFAAAIVGLVHAANAMPAMAHESLAGKRAPTDIIAGAGDEAWRDIDPAHLMVIDFDRGRVTIELSDRFAPCHVAQMKSLVRAGFYDGLSFYRVIDGFVAQAGDVFENRDRPDDISLLAAELTQVLDGFPDPLHLLPRHREAQGTGTDGYADITGILDGMPVGLELNDDPNLIWPLHCTGAVAMARDEDPDTGSTEFYITLQPQRYLDRNLTVFGRVIDGMAHLQALTRQAPPQVPGDPMGDIIRRAFIGDTPPEGERPPRWQVFRTDTALFADYVESRRNRPESFFIFRPDHVDACQLPIPVRRQPAQNDEPSED